MTFHEITELSQIQYIHDRLYEYNLVYYSPVIR